MNSFSFNRLLLLIKRQWIENKMLFLMGVGVLFGLGLLFYGLTTFWGYAQINSVIQLSTFIIGLYFGSAIFTNYIFKDFAEKSSASHLLLLPSTHFEKLLSGIFYSLIIYPIVFFILYFIIDYSFVLYLNVNHESLLKFNKTSIANWNVNIPFINQILVKYRQLIQISVGVWLFIQTFAILGAISFGRWSFIKSAFCGFAVFIVLVLVNLLFHKLMLTDLFLKLSATGFIKEGQLINIEGKPITDLFSDVLVFMLCYILPTILLVASYFKLKEKQV